MSICIVLRRVVHVWVTSRTELALFALDCICTLSDCVGGVKVVASNHGGLYACAALQSIQRVPTTLSKAATWIQALVRLRLNCARLVFVVQVGQLPALSSFLTMH